MKRATDIVAAADWDAGSASDVITLSLEDRRRRRFRVVTDGGTPFLLDFERVPSLRDGDGLVLDDGTTVRVRAADEPLLEVTCRSADELVRIAWHLGNRHLPTQLMGDRLRIRDDHVIEHMLHRLGAETRAVSAPFDPEGGAYGEGHVHDHAHPHDPHHDHD
jgi:urease accessory protein